MFPTVVLAVLFGVAATHAHAAEKAGDSWPMHRGGPQLQGVAQMSAPAAVKLLWTFPAGSPVKSSAAIARGRVFFGTDAGTIHALDLGTGKEIWSFKSEGTVEATPCVVEDTVYVGSADSHLYALEADSGNFKWKYQTGDKVLGGANWAKNPAGDGVWILVGSYDSSLHCVDAASGKAVWTHPTDSYVNGTPAIAASGEVIFGGCDSFLHVVALADGKELRQVEAEAYIASSVAVFEKNAYVGNYGNKVLAFGLQSGESLWSYAPRGFPYFSSAAVTKERVVIGGRDKYLHCVERATGKPVWEFKTRGEVDSSPVICGDSVVFGSGDGRLYCVALASGKERWNYEIGGAVISSPAVADGKIVVGSEDGSVYAFSAASPAGGAKKK